MSRGEYSITFDSTFGLFAFNGKKLLSLDEALGWNPLEFQLNPGSEVWLDSMLWPGLSFHDLIDCEEGVLFAGNQNFFWDRHFNEVRFLREVRTFSVEDDLLCTDDVGTTRPILASQVGTATLTPTAGRFKGRSFRLPDTSDVVGWSDNDIVFGCWETWEVRLDAQEELVYVYAPETDEMLGEIPDYPGMPAYRPYGAGAAVFLAENMVEDECNRTFVDLVSRDLVSRHYMSGYPSVEFQDRAAVFADQFLASHGRDVFVADFDNDVFRKVAQTRSNIDYLCTFQNRLLGITTQGDEAPLVEEISL
jgi:hypothetical protein